MMSKELFIASYIFIDTCILIYLVRLNYDYHTKQLCLCIFHPLKVIHW